MLLQSQLHMFGANIYFLLGCLLLGMLVVAGLLVLWIVFSILLGRQRRARALRAYLRQSRRADGTRYPPAIVGVCDHCGAMRGKIFYTNEGPRLCPECYEMYWPLAEQAKADPNFHFDFTLDFAPEKRPANEPIRPR